MISTNHPTSTYKNRLARSVGFKTNEPNTANPMQFISFRQWQQLPAGIDNLFSTAQPQSVFLSRIWFETLTEYAFIHQQTLLLACVIEKDKVLAVLPLIKRNTETLSSLSNQFSNLFSLILANENRHEQILQCLAAGLMQLPYRSIQITPVDRNDRNLVRFEQLMQAHGCQIHHSFRFYNWTHPLKGQNFDQYIAQRPAMVRNSIHRKQRKLQREHSYTIKLYQKANLHCALEDYHQVYKASWKAHETLHQFTPGLVKNACLAGWLRLAVLYVKEQPIAAQIWLVTNKKANIYRLVHDHGWHKYSPGSILTYYLMQHVITNDKVTEIDFLTGNERYKQDWMSVRNERWSIHFVKPNKKKHALLQSIQLWKKRLAEH